MGHESPDCNRETRPGTPWAGFVVFDTNKG
jgi:hypothetical protein